MRQSFSTRPAVFAPHELFDPPALCALDEVRALIGWDRVAAFSPAGEEKKQAARPRYPALT